MSFIGDSRKPQGPGILPLQDHDKQWEKDPDMRSCLLAVRIKRRPKGQDRLGHFEYQADTAGDLGGGLVWPPEKRPTAGWEFAWPAILGAKPEKTGNAPVASLDAAKGGNVGCCPEAPDWIFKALPIYTDKWDPDERYKLLKPSTPRDIGEAWPKPHARHYGIMLTATKETQQKELFFDTDPRLIAVNADGDPEMASIVCDLAPDFGIDDTRTSKLHSTFRVLKEPLGGANIIAFQLSTSGCGDTSGGYFVDKVRPCNPGGFPDVASVDDPAPNAQNAPGPGRGGLPLAAQGAIAFPGERLIAGRGSVQFRGPFEVGARKDKHRLGLDADQNPINSLHWSTKTLFYRNPIEDGPLKFEGTFPKVGNAPEKTHVHLEWDPKEDQWHWWAETHLYVPKPKRPDEKTPGGGGGRPGQPTTTGGGVNPQGPIDLGGLLDIASVDTAHQAGQVQSAATTTPAAAPFDPSNPVAGLPPVASVDGANALAPAPQVQGSTPIGAQDVSGVKNLGAPARTVASYNEMSMPGMVGRPHYTRAGQPNQKNNIDHTQAERDAYDSASPATFKMAAYGAQGGQTSISITTTTHGGKEPSPKDPWKYTNEPGKSPHPGGSANGGLVFFPPEVDLNDVDRAFKPINTNRSTTYIVAAPNVFFAAGLPSMVLGGVKKGFSWGMDETTGNLVFRQHSGIDETFPAIPSVRLNNSSRDLSLASIGTAFWGRMTPATLSADRTWTFQNLSGVVALQAAATLTPGEVLFADSTGAIDSDPALFWNDTTKRLGIGTNAPNVSLDVNGGQALRATTNASITSDQNDYAIGDGTNFRLAGTAARTITGFTGGVDGKLIIIQNVGSFNLTLAHQSASSTAANRLSSPTNADVISAPGTTTALIYDATISRWKVFIADAVTVAASIQFSNGGRVAWVSVSSVTVGTSAVTTRLADSTGSVFIVFSGTKTAAFGTSGAGGLDTGAEAANTWYALHVIADTSGTNAPAAMLSLSATAPTLPAGYNVFRRVGWVRNNGSSNIIKFFQTGPDRARLYTYDDERTNLQPLSGGSATAFTTVSLAAYVPPNSRQVEITYAYDSAAPTNLAELRTTGSSVADPATYVGVGIAAPTGVTGYMRLVTDASQQIDYRVSAITEDLDIFVIGFEDEI